MKLVDILARELRVWPDDWVVCSQDSDSYIAGYSDASLMRFSNGDWVGMDNFISGDWVLSKHDRGLSSDYPTAIVTRAEWQAAVDALNAPKVVEWDEFGFPASGVTCEFTTNDGHNWKGCKILYADEVSILTGELEGKADRRLLRKCDADVKFRPARTAEQVAAEERDKARTEVLNAMTANGKTANEPEALWQFRLKVVGEMLDMGYRKDTKPCGS